MRKPSCLTLFEHEEEVRAWWGKVPVHNKRYWDSARAIYRNWQNHKNKLDRDPDAAQPPTHRQTTTQANAALHAELQS